MKKIMLRAVPEELHRAIKILATDKDTTIEKLILSIVADNEAVKAREKK